MATIFGNNWACKSIHKMARDKTATAKQIALTLSTQPEFVAAIQEVLDMRNQPGYNPDQPDGDPAHGIVGGLIEALGTPG